MIFWSKLPIQSLHSSVLFNCGSFGKAGSSRASCKYTIITKPETIFKTLLYEVSKKIKMFIINKVLNVINGSPNFHSLSYTVRNKVKLSQCRMLVGYNLETLNCCKAKGALEFRQFCFIGKDMGTAIIKVQRLCDSTEFCEIKGFDHCKKRIFFSFQEK